MADLATKSDGSAAQKEGTRVVTVDKQGTVQTHGGKEVASDAGIAIANSRWGNRSMGNGGVIED
jgi:hypothetical protein